MRRLLIIVACLIIASAMGQSNRRRMLLSDRNIEASAGPVFPTNLAGYPALAWYVGDDYTTNSSVATLPDRWVNAWNLTNSASTTTWPKGQSSGLNGHRVLGFDGFYLRQPAYTSSQPHEIVMVMSITNRATTEIICSSMNSSFEHRVDHNAPNIQQLASGSVVSPITSDGGLTNRWVVYDIVFNGASSTIYSNLVAGVTVNPGTFTESGFTVGELYNLTFPSRCAIAEIATYGTNLSSGARSSLNTYLTNKYNIAQP